MGFVALRADA